MMESRQPAEFSIVDAGVDWFTCTAKASESALQMDVRASEELQRQYQSGVKLVPQTRQGFAGSAGNHFFFGRREHDVMVQSGGPLSDELLPVMVPLASNVSRLDVQVTLFTEGEVANLARDTWSHLKSIPNGNGRPRSFSLIVGHPVGQTLYVNSRSSDNFGRIYDKGVQADLGPAGLLWRYEVELKRKVALHRARESALLNQRQDYAISLVHQWMTDRGVQPPWENQSGLTCKRMVLESADSSVLSWFDETLSKTVATAIKLHGLKAVLASLHLQNLVQPKEGR